MSDERGQALVELIAGVPAVLALGLVMLQLLAVGYSAVLAGNAAEAGALALAGGGEAEEQARKALPGWSRNRVKVRVSGGTVAVRLRPPALLDAVADALAVTGRAEVPAP